MDQNSIDNRTHKIKINFFVVWMLDLFLSDVKKLNSYCSTVFCWKSPIQLRSQLFFFSTKVWTSKSENLVLYDHPTNFDAICAARWFTSNLKSLKLLFSFKLKLRNAVEISHQKILIFEKCEISAFTGKKNQWFWTRIDNFRNCFQTLAYPDVTWSASLKRTTFH